MIATCRATDSPHISESTWLDLELLSGNALVSIKEIALCRAWLVLWCVCGGPSRRV